MEQMFQKQHPFKPTSSRPSESPVPKSPMKMSADRLREISRPRQQDTESRLRRYLSNRIDTVTSQPLFSPLVAKFDGKVFEKAAQAKFDDMLLQQSRLVDKKTRAVFNFLSFNQDILKLQDFDSLHIRAECITLLRDILLALIGHGMSVNYDQFLDLVLEKELVRSIESAYDFLFVQNNPPPPKYAHPLSSLVKSQPKMRKVESAISGALQTPFDKWVRKVYKEELQEQGSRPHPNSRSPSPNRPKREYI